MATAGEYDTRFRWLRHSRPASNAIGEKAAVYTVNGYLWGAIDEPSAAAEDTLQSAANVVRATIRVRSVIAVKPLDQLEDPGWSEVWTVDAVHRGDNETVCEVSR